MFARVKELVDDQGRTERIPREAPLVYALTGERRYADAVRHALTGGSRYHQGQYDKLALQIDPDFALKEFP